MSVWGQIVHGVEHFFGGGSSPRPDPTRFSNGTPVPQPNTGPQSPISSGPFLPVSGSSPFTSAQQSQLQSALNAAGIWGTIQDLGGDVWNVIAKIFPKNADGSIDWGKIGSDVVGFVKDHGKDILTAAAAYNQYQRQGKADALGQQAVDTATQHYNANAPLRDAGRAGMLNPQANTPDISALKTKANAAPLSITPPPPASTANLSNAQSVAGALPVANLNAANRIAGPGSGNPFARAATSGMPPMPSSGSGGLPALPLSRPSTPTTPPGGPSALPISTQPVGPSQPARYLHNGLETGANGAPVAGGYNSLSDYYRQTGTTPGVVNDRVLAMVKQNPALVNALPVADQGTLKRTLASVGAG